MKREVLTREERLNAKVAAMRAQRQRVQREKKRVPVIVSSICAAVLLLGGTAFGVTMFNMNNAKPVTTATAAKLAESAKPVAKTASANQTATQPAKQTTAQTTAQPAKQTTTQTTAQPAEQTAAQTTAQPVQSTQSSNSYSYSYSYSDTADNSTNNAAQVTADNSSAVSAAPQTTFTGTHHSGAVDNGKGNSLHFYQNGKTSKGYDWRYEGGNGLVDVGCDYTFNGSDYDFSLIGKAPGNGTITIWHNTDDNTQMPTTINFNVDENLNVTYN